MIKKVLYLVGFVVACLLVFFYNLNTSKNFLKDKTILKSRGVIEYAENLVKEKKPAPTESALVYAYAATTYYNVLLETGSETVAESSAKYVIENFLHATSTVEYQDGPKALRDILLRMENDGHLKANLGYNTPTSSWAWIDRDNNPKTPFTPNAGKWKRWVTEGRVFTVPPPPKFMSSEYLQAVREVEAAAEKRTPSQGSAINFWGGVPGTVQPAGIWLDQLYSNSEKYKLTDKEYAYVQMVVAQVLSDAFMECWKVKFTYWTKRPDMVSSNIDTAMPNPPFPGYVSGHSTISFAAATVLGAFFPEDKDMYLTQAEEAKNSRLWAGIHFAHDNEEGKKLGVAVGEAMVENLKIQKIR